MTDSEELVDAALREFPETHQAIAFRMRDIIREVGETLALPGGLTETLKWNQPSWLPTKKGIGTTVRVAVHDDAHIGLYVHCQTTLMDDFRATLGDEVSFTANRGVLFDVASPLPEDAVIHCVTAAFTYHRDKTS